MHRKLSDMLSVQQKRLFSAAILLGGVLSICVGTQLVGRGEPTMGYGLVCVGGAALPLAGIGLYLSVERSAFLLAVTAVLLGLAGNFFLLSHAPHANAVALFFAVLALATLVARRSAIKQL
jgi:uncharacterized membrane protein